MHSSELSIAALSAVSPLTSESISAPLSSAADNPGASLSFTSLMRAEAEAQAAMGKHAGGPSLLPVRAAAAGAASGGRGSSGGAVALVLVGGVGAGTAQRRWWWCCCCVALVAAAVVVPVVLATTGGWRCWC